jgi:hypothetical protein
MVQWLVEDNLIGARCAGVRFDCGWLVDLMLNVNTVLKVNSLPRASLGTQYSSSCVSIYQLSTVPFSSASDSRST